MYLGLAPPFKETSMRAARMGKAWDIQGIPAHPVDPEGSLHGRQSLIHLQLTSVLGAAVSGSLGYSPLDLSIECITFAHVNITRISGRKMARAVRPQRLTPWYIVYVSRRAYVVWDTRLSPSLHRLRLLCLLFSDARCRSAECFGDTANPRFTNSRDDWKIEVRELRSIPAPFLVSLGPRSPSCQENRPNSSCSGSLASSLRFELSHLQSSSVWEKGGFFIAEFLLQDDQMRKVIWRFRKIELLEGNSDEYWSQAGMWVKIKLSIA